MLFLSLSQWNIFDLLQRYTNKRHLQVGAYLLSLYLNHSGLVKPFGARSHDPGAKYWSLCEPFSWRHFKAASTRLRLSTRTTFNGRQNFSFCCGKGKKRELLLLLMLSVVMAVLGWGEKKNKSLKISHHAKVFSIKLFWALFFFIRLKTLRFWPVVDPF